MRRQKPTYSKTGAGREAEWEDIERQAEPKRAEREPVEYRKTYTKAQQMRNHGKHPTEITGELDVPAKQTFTTEYGKVPQWAKVERAVEESMVFVRKEAIADALAGRPSKF